MILERIEKDELVEVLYESSNVVASTYNKNDKNLNVVFKNGGSYTYQDVSATDYMRFEMADSQGKELNTTIKKYSFLKHDNVDISETIDRVKKLKQEEVTALENGLTHLMEQINLDYGSNGKINNESLDKLYRMIGIYKDMTK